jgi:hypothetical protein
MRSKVRALNLSEYPIYIRPMGVGLIVDDDTGAVRAAVIKDISGSFLVSSDDVVIDAVKWLNNNLARVEGLELRLNNAGWRLNPGMVAR